MTPMNRLVMTAIAVLGLTFSAPMTADYTGPGGGPEQRTVAEILEAPQDDTLVSIEGRLTRKIDDEKYMFSDGTGEIKVEIDDEDLPANTVDEQTKLVITGEVERRFLRAPKIEVDSVRAVAR